MSDVAPGWYSDPTNPLQERLWDGASWADRMRPRAPQVDTLPVDNLVVLGDARPGVESGTEVLYTLPSSVLQSQRRKLEACLTAKGILFHWDDRELVVDKIDEPEVDYFWNLYIREPNARFSARPTGLRIVTALVGFVVGLWSLFLQTEDSCNLIQAPIDSDNCDWYFADFASPVFGVCIALICLYYAFREN